MTTLVLVHGLSTACLADVRIKDVTSVEGIRTNQLTGMGLVTGLAGTGGTSPITRQFALNMSQKFGNRAPPALRLITPDDTKQRTDNLSIVTVTAVLPTFARPGQPIDVTVSTFDDASSLQGGALIMSPLFGVDNCVYAVASGPVTVGGFSFGGDAASAQKNHPTTGRIVGGATVEKTVPDLFGKTGSYRLILGEPDFQMAHSIAREINSRYPGVASPANAATVTLLIPPDFQGAHVAFLGSVGSLRVVPNMKNPEW